MADSIGFVCSFASWSSRVDMKAVSRCGVAIAATSLVSHGTADWWQPLSQTSNPEFAATAKAAGR
jgi:hypothetical protein